MSLAFFFACFAVTTPEWRKVTDSGGVLVQQRAVADSAFDEFQLTTSTQLSVDTLLATIWDHASYPRVMPYVRALRVLEESETKRYAYLEIKMPVLKDRDYCMRYERITNPATGVVTIIGDGDDSGCPAPRPEQYIRIHKQHATWVLSPRPEGGSKIVYQVRSDLEGMVPAAFVNMGAAAEHAKFLRAVVEAAKKRK